jgi:hypothetical protein
VTAEPALQRCPACGWHGVAHIYNLIWTREWACPSCTRLHAARASTREAVLQRLEETAMFATDALRARRARSLADAFTDVLGRRTEEPMLTR